MPVAHSHEQASWQSGDQAKLGRVGWKLKTKQKYPPYLYRKEKDEQKWLPVLITCNLQLFSQANILNPKLKKKILSFNLKWISI